MARSSKELPSPQPQQGLEKTNPDKYADDLTKTLGFSDKLEDSLKETPSLSPEKEKTKPKKGKPLPEKIPLHQVPNTKNISKAKEIAIRSLETFQRLGFENAEERAIRIIEKTYGFDKEMIEKVFELAAEEMTNKILPKPEVLPEKADKSISVATNHEGLKMSLKQLETELQENIGTPTDIINVGAYIQRKGIKTSETVILDLFDNLTSNKTLNTARDKAIFKSGFDEKKHQLIVDEFTQKKQERAWREKFRAIEERIEKISEKSSYAKAKLSWLKHSNLDEFNQGLLLVNQPKKNQLNFKKAGFFSRGGKLSIQERNLEKLNEMVTEIENEISVENNPPVTMPELEEQLSEAERLENADKDTESTEIIKDFKKDLASFPYQERETMKVDLTEVQILLDLGSDINEMISKLPADIQKNYAQLKFYDYRSADGGFFPVLERGGTYTIKKLGFLERLRDHRPVRIIALERLQDIYDELNIITENTDTHKKTKINQSKEEDKFFEQGEQMSASDENISAFRFENGEKKSITWKDLVLIAKELGQENEPPKNFSKLYEQLQDKGITINDELVANGTGDSLLEIVFEAAGFSETQRQKLRIKNLMDINQNKQFMDDLRV